MPSRARKGCSPQPRRSDNRVALFLPAAKSLVLHRKARVVVVVVGDQIELCIL